MVQSGREASEELSASRTKKSALILSRYYEDTPARIIPLFRVMALTLFIFSVPALFSPSWVAPVGSFRDNKRANLFFQSEQACLGTNGDKFVPIYPQVVPHQTYSILEGYSRRGGNRI